MARILCDCGVQNEKVLGVARYISIFVDEVSIIDNISWSGFHVYVLEKWK